MASPIFASSREGVPSSPSSPLPDGEEKEETARLSFTVLHRGHEGIFSVSTTREKNRKSVWHFPQVNS
jgi:hypothetical protein